MMGGGYGYDRIKSQESSSKQISYQKEVGSKNYLHS